MFSAVRLLIQKRYLASDKAFKSLHASLPRHNIYRDSNLESWVAIVSPESFADSSRAGVVERHVHQSLMHFAESECTAAAV